MNNRYVSDVHVVCMANAIIFIYIFIYMCVCVVVRVCNAMI